MLSTIPYTIPLLPRLNSTLLASMTPTSPSYPIYHSAKTNIVPFFSDHWLALISPIVVYWVLSLAFHVLDVAQIPYFESKRIHESQEVLSRNKASVMQVINAVVLQQVIQTILGYFVMDVEETAHQLVWKDHMQEMEKLTGVVGQAVVLVLGDRTGKSLLMNYGKELVSWTYWWGIPLVQFYLALYAPFPPNFTRVFLTKLILRLK
jgi:sphinganine C4-monooxygenase